jgi:hypothetical protein
MLTALYSMEIPAISIGWIGRSAGLALVAKRITFALAGSLTSLYGPEAVCGTQLSFESVHIRRQWVLSFLQFCSAIFPALLCLLGSPLFGLTRINNGEMS